LRAGQRREAREHKALLEAPGDPGLQLNPKEFLDGELKALPEKYRLPIIMFHLEGRSLDEIARTLSSKPSTIGMRLSRGRDLLRDRISRRGAVLSSSLLFAQLTAEMASAAASHHFVSVTVQAALAQVYRVIVICP
jgi:DNA-directed RNA polymerase specialized sigma24 family protein